MSLQPLIEAVFWLSVGALFYTYAGYPLLLFILSTLRGRRVRADVFEPTVSVIIAAYNEEQDIAAKLENTLSLDYPKAKLEIIVTSDCSQDRTDEIVRSFASRGVRLHRQTERLGKTAAQNAAVEVANGEILLFSDATTNYRSDVLRTLVPNFADQEVGCVTGRVIYTEDSTVAEGTRSYWSYEFLLKKYESSIGSLIGVCGCMYAVRKSAYVPLYHEACSDFLIATMMVQQGLRAIYVPTAVCTEVPNAEATKELSVRVRIIAQTFADLWRNRAMLNPFRKGFYAVQLLSHKVMRYLAPLFLLILLISSGILTSRHWFYAIVFALQIVFYALAAVSWVFEKAGVKISLISLPQYFVITNLASLIAFVKLLRGERYIKWEPLRDRQPGSNVQGQTIVSPGEGGVKI